MKETTTWYNASFSTMTIQANEVEKVTGKFVVINGSRWSKDTEYYAIRPSVEEAKQSIIDHYSKEVSKAKYDLTYAENKLEQALSL